ncbi:uncharacterized protein LOC134851715 [Symsagittifera roscoffensis]|uniref:uncharacterized protein LOC134851715 n=1 Tax=Symsagittifera roscoffensis TaxID=84072 RepID=UPI00307B4B92
MLLSLPLLFLLAAANALKKSDGPPESCFEGPETEQIQPILYNPNITVCRSPNLKFCYQFSHSNRKQITTQYYGCANDDNHPCNQLNYDYTLYTCRDNVRLGMLRRGLLCCSKHTKHFVPLQFSPVSSCYTGTTNSTGDFVVGGDPEKCDETKSLYCVAKMTVLEEDILEAHFFCDQTITDSSCGSDTLASCTEPTNYTKGENRTRVCCCGTADCNSASYMLRIGEPSRITSFPGSPMLLYILLIVFGCIVLLGLVMMAGKQCGASSNDSIDFDDKASFDRLDFDETENDEPSPSEKPMTKMSGKDKFERVEVEEVEDDDVIQIEHEHSPSDNPISQTASV